MESTREEKLQIIADEVQGWLDWQERTHRGGGPLTHDTHLISCPYWPSRGQLLNWIKVLRGDA